MTGLTILFVHPSLWAKTRDVELDLWPDRASQYLQTLNQENLKDYYKELDLATALSQGINDSYSESIRKKSEKILDLNWQDQYEQFWYPNISLNFSASQSHLGIWSGDRRTRKVPDGEFRLEISDYTIFNWGKDYLRYRNQEDTYYYQKKSSNRSLQYIKHDIILKYLAILLNKYIEQNRREKLAHASFVYRFNRERAQQGKIGRQEYYEGRNEYLLAQSQFQEARLNLVTAEEEMALAINDPVGTRYLTNEKINFQKINLQLADALKWSQEQNPSIQDAGHDIDISRRNYELMVKENLPLPKVTLQFGAYGKDFGPSDYETYQDERLELVASLNMSWTILGANGLLNERKKAAALINHRISLESLRQSQHQAASDVKKYFKMVQLVENEIMILEARTNNLQKTFDASMDEYLKGKSSYLVFKTYLHELKDTEVQLEQKKYQHAANKIALAKAVGVYDFPADGFSNLATKDLK